MKPALLLIDIQNDYFPGGALELTGMTQASAQAREVLTMDDGVDRLNVQLFRELLTYMIEEPRSVTRALRITFIAKYLERIADHATNIAQMVIFLCEGQDVRHTPEGRNPSIGSTD